MRKSYWSLALVVCVLVSCDNKEPVKDVEYYLKNNDERDKKVRECRGEIGEPSTSCKNVMKARVKYLDEELKRVEEQEAKERSSKKR